MNHSFALTETNKLYGWGESIYGKLLEADEDIISKPKLINLDKFKVENTTKYIDKMSKSTSLHY
jgi:alpha-tubulin suppressor-like RCC1 family protein